MNTFAEFVSSVGLLPRHIIQDGRIHRCGTEKNPRSNNGAYLYDGTRGWCMRWGATDVCWWNDPNAKPWTEAEKQVYKNKYKQERMEAGRKAAEKAKWILSQCEQDYHPYMTSKGFPEMSVNVWRRDGQEDLMIVPSMINGRVAGCQLINPEGKKKFLKDQICKGAYFQIGSGQHLFYTEGFASGMSLQKVLNASSISNRIVITFSAGNLKLLATRTPGFIVADNDESKTGENAAIATGLRWWMPPAVGSDINDYEQSVGLLRASLDLKKAFYAR